MTTKRKLLANAPIATLRRLVRHWNLDPVDKRRRDAMTEALVRSRRVGRAELERLLGGETAPRPPAEKNGNVFVAIDFETADRYRDSACAVALVRVEGTTITAKKHFLIRPPRRWFEYTHIHGITYDMVKHSPTFGQRWKALAPWFQGIDYLVAHNASFDRSVLRACCEAYGLPTPDVPFLCTVRIARRQWAIYPTRLPDVCRALGIELDHHQALSDAEAAARIFLAALDEGYRP